MNRTEPATIVVGTDPADVDVRDTIVIVPGVEAGRRVARLGGHPVVAHPSRLPLAPASAAVVRADGLFGSAPASHAGGRVRELLRISRDGGVVVASAQVDPGPDGPRTPVDAKTLAEMLPGEPSVQHVHDRICRKDWHRLTATT